MGMPDRLVDLLKTPAGHDLFSFPTRKEAAAYLPEMPARFPVFKRFIIRKTKHKEQYTIWGYHSTVIRHPY